MDIGSLTQLGCGKCGVVSPMPADKFQKTKDELKADGEVWVWCDQCGWTNKFKLQPDGTIMVKFSDR